MRILLAYSWTRPEGGAAVSTRTGILRIGAPSWASTPTPLRMAGRFSVSMTALGGLVGSVTGGAFIWLQNEVWILIAHCSTESLARQAPGLAAGMVDRITQALAAFFSKS